MTRLAQRKRIELLEKLASLRQDFDAWEKLAVTESSPLRLHKSQIEKVTGILGKLAKDFDGFLVKPIPAGEAAADAYLDEAANTEGMILAIHSVWAFFRKKLAQRLEPGFQLFLDAADELAWSCYSPALEASAVTVREPPLVFLNGALSPFMVGRDHTYLPEDVPPRFLTLTEFQGIVAQLPIPVIGLPWAQAGYLPDALTIAHEVGHVVEEDLALEGELDAIIGGIVDISRKEQWLAWREEIFADMWACAAVGPAYLSTLCDFLAADPLRDAEEKGQQDSYPTANLRVWLNLEALRLAGFCDEAEAPLKDIQALWPAAAAPQEKEAAAVVAALLTTKLPQLGNQSVHEVLGPLTPDEYATAINAFNALQLNSQDLGTTNARIVFAAARLGYDADPNNWRASRMGEKLLARYDRNDPTGSLLAPGFRAGKSPADTEQEQSDTAQNILGKLRKLVSETAV